MRLWSLFDTIVDQFVRVYNIIVDFDRHKVMRAVEEVDGPEVPLLGSNDAYMEYRVDPINYFPSYVMFYWLRVYMLMAPYRWWGTLCLEVRHHSSHIKMDMYMGFYLFLFSETMLFWRFFWAFFHNHLSPDLLHRGFPNWRLTCVDAWSVPLVNTTMLILSGFMLTYSHHCLHNGFMFGSHQSMLLSIKYAFLFMHLQYMEYMWCPFSMQNGVFASVFYIRTGFHGAHVIIGTLFLCVNYGRSIAGMFLSEPCNVRWYCRVWYWHFVDLVWIALFCCFYAPFGVDNYLGRIVKMLFTPFWYKLIE